MSKPTKRPRTEPEGKLLLDDYWLNEAEVVLRGIAEECEREYGHKPSLEDFRQLLETKLGVGMEDYFEGCERTVLVKIVIQTKKAPPRQPHRVGDVFAIPLGDGRYAFGRIMREEEAKALLLGTLVEIFRETSNTKRFHPSILASGRLLHPTTINTYRTISNRRWHVIASDDAYRLPDADLDLEFTVLDPPRGWAAMKPLLTGSPLRPISEDDWHRMRANGQGGGLGRVEDLEDRIRAALKDMEQTGAAEKRDGEA
jgi:hypothetical protein